MDLPRACVAFTALASVAALMPTHAAFAAAPCESEAALVTSNRRQLPAPMAARVERASRQARALVRFHRRDDSLERLDRIIALLDGPQGRRLEAAPGLSSRSPCARFEAASPGRRRRPRRPLTIRPFNEDGGPDGAPGSPSGEGVYIDVEGIRLGRTGPGGTLDGDVPSGEIHISATEYPSPWARRPVSDFVR